MNKKRKKTGNFSSCFYLIITCVEARSKFVQLYPLFLIGVEEIFLWQGIINYFG